MVEVKVVRLKQMFNYDNLTSDTACKHLSPTYYSRIIWNNEARRHVSGYMSKK